MTRIRQWLIAIAVAALLTLSFSAVASADPGDPGNGLAYKSGKTPYSASSDPGDPGIGP